MRDKRFFRRICSLFFVLLLVAQLLPYKVMELHAEGEQEGSGQTEATLVTDVSQLESGDKVVLYNPSVAKAISSAGGDNYRTPADVTLSSNVVVNPSDEVLWAVDIQAAGDKTYYTFESVKKPTYYLDKASVTGNLRLKTIAASGNQTITWIIETIEGDHDGLLKITNTNPSFAMSMYYGVQPGKENIVFRTENYDENDKANFGLQMYRIPKADPVPSESPDPVPSESPDPVTPTDDPYTPVKEGKITSLRNLEDGDKIVIYNKAAAKAMSSTPSAEIYRDQSDVTIENEKFVNAPEEVVWTVNISHEETTDGTTGPTVYTFSDKDGKKLTAGSEGHALPVDGENPTWKIMGASTPDSYYIDSATKENTRVLYHVAENRFSTYHYEEENEDYFAMDLYHYVEAPVTPVDPPTPTGDPVLTDGSKVVIYNPANTSILMQAKGSNKYNLGNKAGTLNGKVLEGFEDEDVWTVRVSTGEQGEYNYTFYTADGTKKLGLSNDTYGNTGVDFPNDVFVLEKAVADNQYYVKAVTGGRYVKWNNGYFSSYSEMAQEAAFAQAFYVVPEPKTGLITDLSQLEDGDTVAIYNPASGKALGLNGAGGANYREAVDVSVENEVMLAQEYNLVWTVNINSETGTYTFTLDDNKLSVNDTSNNLPLNGKNVNWNITKAGEKTFYITNADRETQRLIYTVYNNIQEFSASNSETDEGKLQMQLYHVTEKPFDKGKPVIYDGAKVVIYNPANNMALSQNKDADGKYNTGKEVAVTEETVSEYGDTEIYTAEVTEVKRGYTYAFVGQDGKKLAMGTSDAWIKEGDVNDQWILEDKGNNKYFVRNVARNTYLEWFASKNNWTTYTNTSNASLFETKFFILPKEEGLVEDANDLVDGDTVVIVNKQYGKALSQEYTPNYNIGIDVTIEDNKVTNATNVLIWTVGVTVDSSGKKLYTFSTEDGKKIGMAADKSSMPLGGVNDQWEISAGSQEKTYLIKNTVRGSYMEWYATQPQNSPYWSAYHKIAEADKPMFDQQFYRVSRKEQVEKTLNDGDRVVIYNLDAKGSIGPWDGMTSMEVIPTTIEDGKAVCENGAYIFTVHKNGDDYLFEADGKYLAINNENDGESIILSDTPEEDITHCTTWNLEMKNDSFLLISKNAKYKGSKVYAEFFSGKISGYTYKAANVAIYLFDFYPVAEGTKEYNDMVNNPKLVFEGEDKAVLNGEYKGKFKLDDLSKDHTSVEATITKGDTTIPVEVQTENNSDYTFVLNGDATATMEDIVIDVLVTKADGSTYGGQKTVTMVDDVIFSNMTPTPNTETGDDLRPTISVEVENAGEGYTATLKVGKEIYEPTIDGKTISYTPTEDMKNGRTSATYTVTRQDGKEFSKTWTFTIGIATEGLYFGQLHSHTQYSDGAGSLESALEYLDAMPESSNVDFVAFTDHSNYFDTSGEANPEGAMHDMSLATDYSKERWASYTNTIRSYNDNGGKVLAIPGFEMTWSGGPGHMNTFNSVGIVSRNNKTLNNKTNDAGMKAYYEVLKKSEGKDTISQFNHPGATFGTFADFSYWDAVLDDRIFLVEVGNGEGQIGQGGYYPSYEYYQMALDKGWHLAPTNNQDNHKGRWGNANDARDVILTDDFSEEGLYQAMRDMRIYATEDKNLELFYTINDSPLGTIFSETPESLDVKVQISDPDSKDKNVKVELVANSGVIAHTWDNQEEISSGELSTTLSPEYTYYYVRVTQNDGDKAVTAPIWVSETLKLGLSSVESSTMMPVTGEELTLTTTVFNSESIPATVKSVTYTTNGSKVLGVDNEEKVLESSTTLAMPFKYTPTEARVMKVTATVVLEQGGKEYTYSKDIELDISDSSKLVYIGIDASHYNEYVAGNYKDSMGNFAGLASENGVRTVILNTKEDLLAACENDKYIGLIFTAPSRRNGTSLRDPYKVYEADEIEKIVEFNKKGGLVIVANWSDYYENYGSFPADHPEDQMAATQNGLLEALGSSLRVGDDGTLDDELNGGQNPRLYLSTYNLDNPLMEGVIYDAENPNDRLYTEVFSHYGGSSIYAVDAEGNPTETLPSTVSPAVYGHASTYSKDQDNDGFGTKDGNAIPKYAPAADATDKRVLITASEDIEGQGRIIVSGGAFMSNFEVQKQADSGSTDTGKQLNYSNYKICENLLKEMNTVEVSTVADVRAKTEPGYKFTIEVVVTSNASGYDKDTAFFDCIYGQDETGGINLFPVAGNFKIGDKVRVTGKTDFYQGEIELQVSDIKLISEGNEVTPVEVTSKQVTDREVEGQLITLKGTVESYEEDNGLIQTIMVKDANGDVARVFIDGYITTSADVENIEGSEGFDIEVTGLASYDDTFKAPEGPFPRIRVRDRKDVVITPKTQEEIDQDKADAVSEMIEALPNPEDVTTDDKEAIQAASDAYDNLTDEQKAKVDQELVEKLEKDKEALQKAQEEKPTKKGWNKTPEGWTYIKDDGTLINNGWFKDKGEWYYFKNDIMQTGWVKHAGKWYYLKSSGAMVYDTWREIDGTWYAFKPNGEMRTGWLQDKGKWYYLASNGAMKTGFVKVGNYWYYFNPKKGGPKGSMMTGWVKDNGNWYYMNSSGVMQTNKWIDNYHLDASGKWDKSR